MLIFDPLFPKTNALGKVTFARSQEQSLRGQPVPQQDSFILDLLHRKIAQDALSAPFFYSSHVDLCDQMGGVTWLGSRRLAEEGLIILEP
jgi:hypothetical protein